MTTVRRCKCGTSNYFDRVLRGIGKRGSSFTDVDAMTHDRHTHRFLAQEFKHDGEEVPTSQHWMLKDLAKIPDHFTVWQVVARSDGRFGFAVYRRDGTLSTPETISADEYRARFHAWWYPPTPPPQRSIGRTQKVTRELTSDEISW